MDDYNFTKHKCKLKNGEILSYIDTQTDLPVLLMIHGNMSSCLFFFSLKTRIEKRFRVIAVDLRGFGDSTYYSKINSLHDLSDDIKLFLDELNINKCSMLGWSTGGAICLSFGIKYPSKTEKIIIVGSVSLEGFPIYKTSSNGKKTKDKIVKIEDLSDDRFSRIFNEAIIKNDYNLIETIFNSIIFNIKKLPSDIIKMLVKQVVLQRNFLDIMFCLSNFNLNETIEVNNRDEQLIKLTSEVMIIHGENDKVIPLESVLSIKNRFTELIRYKIYRNCGHCPFFDCEDLFVNDISKFLNTQIKF